MTERITPLVQREMAGTEKDEEEEQVQAKLVDSSIIQREEENREDEEEKTVKTKADHGHAQETSPSAASALESLRGKGQPLSPSLRAFYEPRFGHDFSQVRIHHDAQAAESASAVNARVYTVGRDIVFGRGQYAPGTSQGQRLMAHELTHVVQQGGASHLMVGGMNRSSHKPAHGVQPIRVRTTQLEPTLARFDIPGWDCPRQLAPVADARAQASGLPGLHNGPADAYRHCWWSCEVVKQCSQFSAIVAGTGHEIETLTSSESAMDLENNAVGRTCATSGATGATCDACCRGQLARGGLTVMVEPTPTETQEARLSRPIADLADAELGPAIEQAHRRGEASRTSDLIEELSRRGEDESHFGVGLPRAIPVGAPGNAQVTPEIAIAMVENMLRGQPPFRPELGRGGCSWFVTEGNPHTGVSESHTVPVQVDLINTTGGLRLEQSDLERMFSEELARARPEVEAQVRERFRISTGRDAPAELSRTLRERVARQLRGLAERMMWERVGRQVAASPAQVGEVILPGGSAAAERAGGAVVFSENPGRFTLVADATRIRLRGGLGPLLDAIRASPGVTPIRVLEGSAEELLRSLRLAGQVRSVFRIGGRILIVVAIASDVYRIITAEDRVEATLESVGGWAVATAASAAFAALWTPADVAGPWAWALHGVGILLSGAIGYWIGSHTTRTVYRLIVRATGEVAGS